MVNSVVTSLRYVVFSSVVGLSWLYVVTVVPWSHLPYDQTESRALDLRVRKDCTHWCQGKTFFLLLAGNGTCGCCSSSVDTVLIHPLTLLFCHVRSGKKYTRRSIPSTRCYASSVNLDCWGFSLRSPHTIRSTPPPMYMVFAVLTRSAVDHTKLASKAFERAGVSRLAICQNVAHRHALLPPFPVLCPTPYPPTYHIITLKTSKVRSSSPLFYSQLLCFHAIYPHSPHPPSYIHIK